MDFLRSLFRWCIVLGILGGCVWFYLNHTSQKKAQASASSQALETARAEEVRLKERVNQLIADRKEDETILAHRYNALHIQVTWIGQKGTFEYDILTNNRLQNAGTLTADQRSELLDLESKVKIKRDRWREGQTDLEQFQKNHPEIAAAARQASGPHAPWEPPPPKTTLKPPAPPIRPPPDNYNPVGKTEAEITARWGAPTGRIEIGDELQLTFPQGNVTMKGGRAAEFTR